MSESRGASLVLLLGVVLFLSWGLDAGFRNAVLHQESAWLIDCLDTDAYVLGTTMDRALHRALGPLMAQPRASWGEGWVMGLRQILTRIGAQASFLPLLGLSVFGAFVDAHTLRKQRATSFTYTSPLQYRQLQGLTRLLLLAALGLVLAPLPLHPLLLLGALMGAGSLAAAAYAAYMKQI